MAVKIFAATLMVLGLTLAGSVGARAAEPVTAYTVLTPEDVGTYRAIFAAEDAGAIARSDRLIAELEDTSLVGYVLQQRYLGRHTTAKFAELKTWLQKYGDHADADRIYRLALRRAPKNTRVTPPVRAAWRGAPGDGFAFDDMSLDSKAAERMGQRLRALARAGRPEAAEALLRNLGAKSGISQADAGRLLYYVATAYLGEVQDEAALALAEAVIARGGPSALPSHWTAGLAAYRLGQPDIALAHFQAVAAGSETPRTYAAASFWAARSAMQAGRPELVLGLYERAASQGESFYGLLAGEVLGRNMAAEFTEPALDSVSFAGLMLEKSAHRAVALWQIGRRDHLESELSRAFGRISPELDPAFAALARNLGMPELELRAAETAAPEWRLTSLYPLPPYEPKGGYEVDQAIVLAIARQESRFRSDALSRAGARGIMQIMPATAVTITRDSSLAGRNKARLDDPVYSITLGHNYLRDLLIRQNGNLINSAAAYNAGEGNLSKWQAVRGGDNDPLLFVETLPLAETRDYVKRVMTNMWMYRRRLGQAPIGLDEAAAGAWPTHVQAPSAGTP
jgi:soluble lytic murein transglycosylase